MWNGSELKPIGITRLIVKNPKIGKKFSVEFVVVPDDYTPIIGARTAQQMKLITVYDNNFTTVSPNNVNDVSMKDHLIKKYEERTGNPSRSGAPTGRRDSTASGNATP